MPILAGSGQYPFHLGYRILRPEDASAQCDAADTGLQYSGNVIEPDAAYRHYGQIYPFFSH